MKKLLRTMFLMIVVGLVVAGVASYMSKKRLESKSDDEIREFLARKLDGKVGEAQLATIQDAVIGGIRGKSSRDDVASPDDEAAPEDEAAPDDEDADTGDGEAAADEAATDEDADADVPEDAPADEPSEEDSTG